MKNLLLSLTLSLFCTYSFAAEVPGKIELGPVMHYIASPEFGKKLQEATEFANGWKIRIDYATDTADRTTYEKVMVTVVGQADCKYLKSSFAIAGVNGGRELKFNAIERYEITEEEFLNFKE